MEKSEDTLFFELYGLRLLVFLENKPQSNKYRQVFLGPKEFKKVSFNIGKVKEKLDKGMRLVESKFSEEVYDLPDLKEIYDPDSGSK